MWFMYWKIAWLTIFFLKNIFNTYFCFLRISAHIFHTNAHNHSHAYKHTSEQNTFIIMFNLTLYTSLSLRNPSCMARFLQWHVYVWPPPSWQINVWLSVLEWDGIGLDVYSFSGFRCALKKLFAIISVLLDYLRSLPHHLLRVVILFFKAEV